LLWPGQENLDTRTEVTTLHIVSYFAGTDVFMMSLHKPIITRMQAR